MPTDLHARRLTGAAGVHYAALAVSFVVILWIGRDQWFFGDDWAILVPRNDGAIMVPHVGHWNLVPAVVFPLVRNWLGLGSYLPFLALAVLVHLLVAHLVWRILRRIGTNDWVAAGLSVFVMLLGAASENLLWAFQFGFMGAIALGLAVVLLLDRPRLAVATVVVIVGCSLLAPMFSGTAIPVLAAAAVVGWIRHGFLRTAALLAPAALTYLLWFFLVARNYPTPHAGIASLTDLGMVMLFAAAMYAGGLGRAFPFIAIGVIPAAIAGVWFFATIRKGIRTAAAPAYALVIGSVVFALLTAYSRSTFGLSVAASERYAYVTIVLLVPAFGLLLTKLARRGRSYFISVMVFLALLAGFNAFLLVPDAGAQASREAASQVRIEDALARVIQNPTDPSLLASVPDPQWAPDVTGSDLLELYRSGQLAPAHR